MGEIVYEALRVYYNVLEKTGYMSYENIRKLLVLIFYNDLVYNDYRGLITREDYRLIERALDCLYGSTCLIPYPDYLKMGKLHLGEITELNCRVKTLENTKVLKLIHDLESVGSSPASDIIIVADSDAPAPAPSNPYVQTSDSPIKVIGSPVVPSDRTPTSPLDGNDSVKDMDAP